jgi:hypothetical protein
MQRRPVSSSAVRSVGYDAAGRTLEVEFASGDIYLYFDVPPELHEGLMAAGSVGTFVNKHVRENFRYVKT